MDDLDSLIVTVPYQVMNNLKKRGYHLERLHASDDMIGQLKYDFDYGEVIQVTRRIESENRKSPKYKPKKTPWAWYVVCVSACVDC